MATGVLGKLWGASRLPNLEAESIDGNEMLVVSSGTSKVGDGTLANGGPLIVDSSKGTIPENRSPSGLCTFSIVGINELGKIDGVVTAMLGIRLESCMLDTVGIELGAGSGSCKAPNAELKPPNRFCKLLRDGREDTVGSVKDGVGIMKPGGVEESSTL